MISIPSYYLNECKPIYLILVIFIISIEISFGQTGSPTSTKIIAAVENIKSEPISVNFTNTLELNNTGGHIQGIQHVAYRNKDYYVLSGSSDSYSYYAIVKTGNENLTISVNRILEKPFKHAGGFQIHNNLMAIGVEDNDEKNKSKVFIFSLDNPERPPTDPIAIIDRMGTFKRATAGCVGITIINKKVLVVVGDWDTEHLDFYRIDHEKLGQPGAELELEYTLNSKKMSRSGWIDDRWLSYQNINFIKDDTDNLYLAGMTSIEDEDILDVYEIQSADLSTFSLNKIYTRNFGSHELTKFRWGAGIQMNENQGYSILSSEDNIHKTTTIHLYK